MFDRTSDGADDGSFDGTLELEGLFDFDGEFDDIVDGFIEQSTFVSKSQRFKIGSKTRIPGHFCSKTFCPSCPGAQLKYVPEQSGLAYTHEAPSGSAQVDGHLNALEGTVDGT